MLVSRLTTSSSPFRNELWPGYKTGEGVDPDLWSQAWPLEEALAALGVVVWPMVELEADDALASAAAVAEDDAGVEQVIICTPDKDLGQCVAGTRVVQLDRRKNLLIDESGVVAKFGVGPPSIPDYLALVGDSADGFPGLAGWGAKSAAAVLARWVHLEDIPADPADWEVTVRGAAKLAATLRDDIEHARLFKDLATLRVDRSLLGTTDDLRWRGPSDGLRSNLCRSRRERNSHPGREAGGQPGRSLAQPARHAGHGAREAEVADVEVPAVGEADRTGHPRVEGDEEIAGGIGEHRLAPWSIDTVLRSARIGLVELSVQGPRGPVQVATPTRSWRCSSRCPRRRGNRARRWPPDRAPRRSPTPRADPASAGMWAWSRPRRICRWGRVAGTRWWRSPGRRISRRGTACRHWRRRPTGRWSRRATSGTRAACVDLSMKGPPGEADVATEMHSSLVPATSTA